MRVDNRTAALTVETPTQKTMKKIIATILIFSAIGLGVVAFGVGRSRPNARPNANADAFTRGPDVDRSSAVVQLKGDPLSTESWYQAGTRQKNRFQK